MANNLIPGLVSVTFRQFQYKNIIKHMKYTPLKCIEWGSDIHAVVKNEERAMRIREESESKDIIIAAYGSYYRLGFTGAEKFPEYLQIAEILGTDMIRVWGGINPSSSMGAEARKVLINDILNISKISKEKNIFISVEYHPNTITDTVDSALDFIKAVRSEDPDIYLYWQPDHELSFQDNKKNLLKICPYLSNVHVFAWEGKERRTLYEHRDNWREYFEIIRDNASGEHSVMLEFVLENTVEQFVRDAEVLCEIIEKI